MKFKIFLIYFIFCFQVPFFIIKYFLYFLLFFLLIQLSNILMMISIHDCKLYKYMLDK